jgi:hypothetical protein
MYLRNVKKCQLALFQVQFLAICVCQSIIQLFTLNTFLFIFPNIMAPPSQLCCLSQPRFFNNTCSNCKRWKLEVVKIRRFGWNAGVFKFKCDHGPHTEYFYLSTEGDVAISDGGRKQSADTSLIQTMPKRREPPDYKEKDSNEIKVAVHLYHARYYNFDTEGVHFEM